MKRQRLASLLSVTPGLTRGPAALRGGAGKAGPRIKSGVTTGEGAGT
jgi:hypothetical protein